MAIPAWRLAAPIRLGLGLTAVAVQLRQLVLSFPPDSPAGGLVQLAYVDATGTEIGDRLLHALTVEDAAALGDSTAAQATRLEGLLRAKGWLTDGDRFEPHDHRVRSPEPAAPATGLGTLG